MLKKVLRFIFNNLSSSQLAGVMSYIKKKDPDMHKAVQDVQDLKRRARKTKDSADRIANIVKKYDDDDE